MKRPSSSATTDKENFSPTLNTTGMSNSGSNAANGTNSKARKSLANNWAPREDSFSAPETPSKSLVGTSDASMLFSPPGILKETLTDDSGFDGHRMVVVGGAISADVSESSPSTSGVDPLAINSNTSGRSPPKNKVIIQLGQDVMRQMELCLFLSPSFVSKFKGEKCN